MEMEGMKGWGDGQDGEGGGDGENGEGGKNEEYGGDGGDGKNGRWKWRRNKSWLLGTHLLLFT